ncbi:MAG: 3-oxoacyl-ACP reductase [Deltaproteobacteria bacterium]|nr:3-oxoacyl-ACP reductase [Deltaproteobacteria bacterium]
MNLEGKVVVVTGGGRGLGRAFTSELADKGVNLALVDLNQDDLNATKEMALTKGVKTQTYVTDVAKEDEVVSLFDQIVKDFGQVDGLINNAGITRDGLIVRKKKIKDEAGNVTGEEIQKMSMQNWQSVIDVNLTGVFLCAREFFEKQLQLGGKGVCINISSISRNGNMGQTNYTATKAGVAAMTVTWAKEMAQHGVRCAAIAPGYINTEMVAAIREDLKQKIIDQVPIRRLGEPLEIARTAVFILENDYITGRVIEVDGGLRI